MADDTPGATPDTEDAPLGEGGRKALEAERAARREAEKRLRAAEERLAALEAERLRAEVAAAKGVPVDLLHGSTKEELEAYADRLLTFRGGNTERYLGRPKEKLRSGAAPEVDTDTPARVAERLFSR